jgi:hypothetical protein
LSDVATQRPNPETIEALLDTMWRMAANESARTEALDRKGSTLVTFAALLTTLTGTLGVRFVETAATWWAVSPLTATLSVLLAAVVLAVLALLPREYLTLGLEYLRRFPLWGEIRKEPEEVRGETMQGLLKALAHERSANDSKTRLVTWSYVILVGGLGLTALQAVTLAAKEVL